MADPPGAMGVVMTMAVQYRTDQSKAVETLLYVTQRVHNVYTALKVIYFADKAHLEKYGRLIYWDRYVAMMHGPVPSMAYDIVKSARGDAACWGTPLGSDALTVSGNNVSPHREANLDLLSTSDIECLDEAIKTYGKMSFRRLKDISHKDKAFLSADTNDTMSIEAIAKSLPRGEELLRHLRGE